MTLPYIGPASARDAIFDVGGIDAANVVNFQNQNGLDPSAVITRAAAALGAANEVLMRRWGPFLYLTRSATVEYREGGGGRKTPHATDFTDGDGVRGVRNGHMLPLYHYADTLAWSQAYLMTAYESQVDADIQEMVDSWFLRVDADMVNRLFSAAETPVGNGYSAGWADGSASNVPYIPPATGSQTFDSNHTHYLYEANSVTAARLKAELVAAVKTVREHAIAGRLTALVSDADVDTWTSVNGFVELVPEDIHRAGDATTAAATGEFEGMAGERFGYVNTGRGYVELRYLEQIPTGYLWAGRSYGENNPKNPLAVRLMPNRDFGMRPEVVVTPTLTPRIETVSADAWYGVGVNNRVNGAVSYVAAGLSDYEWTTV
jgi:hypothetical protein